MIKNTHVTVYRGIHITAATKELASKMSDCSAAFLECVTSKHNAKNILSVINQLSVKDGYKSFDKKLLKDFIDTNFVGMLAWELRGKDVIYMLPDKRLEDGVVVSYDAISPFHDIETFIIEKLIPNFEHRHQVVDAYLGEATKVVAARDKHTADYVNMIFNGSFEPIEQHISKTGQVGIVVGDMHHPEKYLNIDASNTIDTATYGKEFFDNRQGTMHYMCAQKLAHPERALNKKEVDYMLYYMFTGNTLEARTIKDDGGNPVSGIPSEDYALEAIAIKKKLPSIDDFSEDELTEAVRTMFDRMTGKTPPVPPGAVSDSSQLNGL